MDAGIIGNRCTENLIRLWIYILFFPPYKSFPISPAGVSGKMQNGKKRETQCRVCLVETHRGDTERQRRDKDCINKMTFALENKLLTAHHAFSLLELLRELQGQIQPRGINKRHTFPQNDKKNKIYTLSNKRSRFNRQLQLPTVSTTPQ